MAADLTDFIHYIADRLPCVVQLDFELESGGNCKLTMHDQYGTAHTYITSRHFLVQGDRAWDMVCTDLRATIFRDLVEKLMEQWQADKQPGQCVALLQHGEFQCQTTMRLPPLARLPVDIMHNGQAVLFLLHSYDPLTRVALYRSGG